MKKNFLKHLAATSSAMLLLIAVVAVTFTSCKDPVDPDDPIVIVEDGYYLTGEACAYTDANTNLMFAVTRNEVDQTERATLYELYVALTAGKNFNITQIAGSTTNVYGGGLETVAVEGNDQPTCDVQAGAMATGGNYTVPADGLYHVVFDTELNKVLIIPVPKWDILGGATPLGWTDTDMPQTAFSTTAVTFAVSEVVLREGDYKFRYNGGWKMGIDAFDETATVKVNTNFGGTLDALVPGGDNIPFAKADEGYYTITANWTVADGMVFTLTWTGAVEPLPEYPDNIYVIGSGIGGWDWTVNDIQMIPVHSHPYAFWLITWLEAGTDNAIKFSPEQAWGSDFGVEEGDVIAPGVYTKGTNNLLVPEVSGYYQIYVNLESNTITIAEPMVYLMGPCAGDDGSWAYMESAMFTFNGDHAMVSPAIVADSELRLAVNLDAAFNWWQAEFIVLDGVIEFRGDAGDQTRVNVTAGQIVTLNFDDNTGSIQ